jgi:hypothetical protein
MSIVVKLIKNTYFKIQIWVIKISCKLYTHKIRELKMLKPKQQIKL